MSLTNNLIIIIVCRETFPLASLSSWFSRVRSIRNTLGGSEIDC